MDSQRLSELLIRFSNSLKWLAESGIEHVEVPKGWQLPDFSGLHLGSNTIVKPDLEATQFGDSRFTEEGVEAPATGGVARLLDEIGPSPSSRRSIQEPLRETESTEKTKAEVVDYASFAPHEFLTLLDTFLREEGIVEPTLKDGFKRAILFERLKSELAQQSPCPVCRGQQEAVMPLLGNASRVLFIADEPDINEQLMGIPYVGETGTLVAKMVKAMGLTRAEVGFSHVNWCAHPEASADDVAGAWSGFLERYIALARPEAIVAFGECAARRLTGETAAFPHLRGQWFVYQDIPVLPTFHPSALLQHPAGKAVVWGDLKNVMRRLGIGNSRR